MMEDSTNISGILNKSDTENKNGHSNFMFMAMSSSTYKIGMYDVTFQLDTECDRRLTWANGCTWLWFVPNLVTFRKVMNVV